MKTLTNIRIQGRAAERLARAVQSGKFASAYLLEGRPGVGKLELVKAVSSALLCVAEPGRGCGACPGCTRVASFTHPDFLVYWLVGRLAPHYARLWPDEAAIWRLYEERCSSHKRDAAVVAELRKTDRFLVESVRDFQEEVGRPPSEGPRKVFAVLEPERMTDEAANALLKTLEEPPPRAVFFLVSHDARNILDTVMSRCAYVRLPELTAAQVVEVLVERYGVADEDARWAAERSSGTVMGALAALDPGYRDLTAAAWDFVARLGDDPGASYCLSVAEAFGRGRDEARAFLIVLAEVYRDLLVSESGAPGLAVDRERADVFAAKDVCLPLEPARALSELDAALDALDRNASPKLTLEYLFLRLAGITRTSYVL